MSIFGGRLTRLVEDPSARTISTRPLTHFSYLYYKDETLYFTAFAFLLLPVLNNPWLKNTIRFLKICGRLSPLNSLPLIC